MVERACSCGRHRWRAAARLGVTKELVHGDGAAGEGDLEPLDGGDPAMCPYVVWCRRECLGEQREGAVVIQVVGRIECA
jgi:hypothetical protein